MKKRLYAAQGDVKEFALNQTKPTRNLFYSSVKNCTLYKGENLICATSGYPMVEVKNPKDTFFLQEHFPLTEDKRGRRIHLRKERARYVMMDKLKEQLWCVYSDQLYYHTAKEDVVISPEDPIAGLCLAQTNDGTIWVGTINDGVLGIKNDSIVLRLNQKDGLVSSLWRQTPRLRYQSYRRTPRAHQSESA